MLEYFYEPRHHVLMVRARGVYDLEAMRSCDDFVRRFVERNGPVRALYDFSKVEELALAQPQLAERAREPSIAGGLRIMVAPTVFGTGLARSYSEWQSNAGQTAVMVVGRLEERPGDDVEHAP